MRTAEAIAKTREQNRLNQRRYRAEQRPWYKKSIEKMVERAEHRVAQMAQKRVERAIERGELVRQPCEECGKAAEAHHDSYLDDDLLKVRWLCHQHHRIWHRRNRPIYPAECLTPVC